MEKVKKFLLAPDENKDEFWDSDALIWIDWREYDEDKIQFECLEIEKERGVDIFCIHRL